LQDGQDLFCILKILFILSANASVRLDFILSAATLFSFDMNLPRKLFAICAGLLLALNVLAQDANTSTNGAHDDVSKNYLQIQEQIHATQLAIEENQQAAADTAKSNADMLAARLQTLEQSVAAQHGADAEAARQTQRLTLFLAGAFGLAGLGIMLLMVYFQWRAFTQLAEISSQHQAALANAGAVHQLAAPGRATVESSNARLLDVVGQLEKRINELEGGQKLLPEIAAAKAGDPLADIQKLLDGNQPQAALDAAEKFLAAHPANAEALVKRAVALEKLGRNDEALASCDRAIAADGALAIAHLHKGGLLNRLRRYDEALDCYERALLAQEKKAKV
jgi:tetratricopeptide (TPR) repeat protein